MNGLAAALLLTLAAGAEIRQPSLEDAHEKHIRYAAFSPDGSRFATVAWDTKLKVWDTKTLELLFEGNAQSTENYRGSSFSSVIFTPDGKQVAAFAPRVGEDWLHLYDVESGKLETRITGPGSYAAAHCSAIAFSPDGNELWKLSKNSAWKADLQAKTLEHKVVPRIPLAADNLFFVDGVPHCLGPAMERITLFNLEKEEVVNEIALKTTFQRTLLDPKQEFLFCGGDRKGNLLVLKVHDVRQSLTIQPKTGIVAAFSLLPDKRVAIYTGEGRIECWSYKDGSFQGMLEYRIDVGDKKRPELFNKQPEKYFRVRSYIYHPTAMLSSPDGQTIALLKDRQFGLLDANWQK